jgi:4-amino-4-deoxy-L-arabinose transferase-like glycosyltransferase
VIAIYLLGLLMFKDGRKAFLSGLILMSSILYLGLARAVMTDMIFSIFVLLSLASFLWGYYRQDRKLPALLLFFIFAGLATLTKGPLGMLVPFLIVCVFLVIRKDMKFLYCGASAWGFLIFLIISVPWYVFMIRRFGHDFTHEFFYNDHILRILRAEHIKNDTWYFYPATMIIGMFPWSLFVAAALAFLPGKLRHQKGAAYLFFACWIGVTFLVFQFAHSKLISYIFPAFPALALMAGDFIYDRIAVNKLGRMPFLILAGNTIMVLLIPVIIAVGINIPKYSAYLSTKIPFYCLIILFLVMAAAMAFFLFRNKGLKNAYALALVIPLFLCAIGYERNDINPYESSKLACKYLLKNYKVDNTILCSKFFVRGVRYYTDKEVAVVDVPGEQFFSPHPVPMLNSDQKIRDFLNTQAVTYCIVKRASREDIERAIGREFKYEMLNKIGNEYIVRITRR